MKCFIIFADKNINVTELALLVGRLSAELFAVTKENAEFGILEHHRANVVFLGDGVRNDAGLGETLGGEKENVGMDLSHRAIGLRPRQHG